MNKDRMEWLKIALENLDTLKGRLINEEDTKRLIIEPLLAWIGYDVWGAKKEGEQYSVLKEQYPGEKRVDYALMKPRHDKPYAFIETKCLRDKLDLEGDLEDGLKQIDEYCKYKGVRFGIVTNGESWVLVDKKIKTEGDELASEQLLKQLVFKVKVGDDLGNERKGYEALLLLNLDSEKVLDELCEDIKKLCESGISDLEEHRKTAIVKALDKIKIPVKGVEKGEWPKNLNELNGKEPPEYVWINDEKFEIPRDKRGSGKRVCHGVPLVTAGWLMAQGKLKKSVKLPNRITGRVREKYFIHTECKQVGKAKQADYAWVEIPNSPSEKPFYLYKGSGTLAQCVADALALLEYFGYSPDILKPPADWKPTPIKKT